MNSRFHHRGISRLNAEKLLMSKGKEGSFLVRDSETTQGAYTLCLLNKNCAMKQYRILPDEHGLLHIQAVSGVEEKRFPNISALVEYYMSRGENNGLECALINPVQTTPPAEDRDSDDDEDDYELDENRLTSIDGSIDPATLLASASPQLSLATAQLAAMSSATAVGHGSTRKPGAVAEYFQKRFQQLNLSELDGGFVNKLREYSESGVTEDAKQVASKKLDRAQNLDKLISEAFRDVDKALDLFISKMDVLRELFAPLKNAKLAETLAKHKQSESLMQSMDAAVDKIQTLKGSVSNLQQKAVSQCKRLQEDDTPKHDTTTPPRPPKPREIPKEITSTHYKVKKQGRPATPMILTVDVTQGKVLAAKSSDKAPSKFTDVLTQDKVLQLVKNTKNNKVLDLHIMGQKMQTYEFENVRYRESFCQMVHQMKVQHSGQEELASLTIFIGTWNLGDSNFPHSSDLEAWLTCQGSGKSRERQLRHQVFDMYVLGFQEIPLREDKLVKKIQDVFTCLGLENEVQLIASKTLWSIGIVVFMKPKYKNNVFYLETASEATGIANTLGNKGAVGVSFSVNGTSFCFVCGHLAARQDPQRNERRNQNYRDIIKGMRNLGSKKLNNVVDLTNKFHHVFFLGDLNYRINDPDTKEILRLIEQEDYSTLLEQDQLKGVQKEGRAFVNFREEEITFPPTYRTRKGSVKGYVVEKVKKSGIRYNTPSWCDRVLWRSYPDLYVNNSSYGSVEEITTSDHKPVFASFQLGIAPTSYTIPPCSPTSSKGPETVIVFDEVSAKVHMNNNELLTIEFHSLIFEPFKTSRRNKHFNTQGRGFCCPRWVSGDFDKFVNAGMETPYISDSPDGQILMKPVIGDVEYLEEQHVILVVKSEDNMESYGEAVVSLRDKCTSTPTSFSCTLTHQGEKTGSIWGKLHMEGASKMKPRQRKSYELVWLDTEAYGEVGRPPLSQSRPSSMATAETGEELYSEPIGDDQRHKMAQSQAVTSADPDSMYYEEVPTAPTVSTTSNQSTNLRVPVMNAAQRKSAPVQSPSAETKATSTSTNTGTKVPQGGTKQRRHMAKSDHSYTNVDILPKETKPTPQPRTNVKTDAQTLKKSEPLPPKPCGPRVQKALEHFTQKKEYNNNEVGGAKSVEHDDRHLVAANQSKDKNPQIKPTDKWPASIKGKPEENPVYGCEESAASARDIPRIQVVGETYEVLEGPLSVESWLKGLDLSQYAQAFIDDGWDKIQFLKDLKKEDLINLNIRNVHHQTRILQSIRNLNK